MIDYHANETVTMSLERYQELLDQMEYLESKSIDNFIEKNYVEIEWRLPIGSTKRRVCESIEIDLNAIEKDLSQRHLDVLTIPKTEIKFIYKGGSKELANGLYKKEKAEDESSSQTED
ncbi:hypothetical protein [Bacillus toyonensis]|uniref:hypothetical protein n=1 Tax=Bacillus toyonensis TaxID=155322 RepID=UPI0002795DCF|nr:hypothetical protein [Bacillus toyonensis]EJQ77868.1 hypothetical protein IGO_05687 [Bacillus toyonensis]